MKVNDIVKLSSFLEKKREVLKTTGSSFTALAESATSQLGFKVTTGAVKSTLTGLDILLTPVKRVQQHRQLAENLQNLILEMLDAGSFSVTYLKLVLNDSVAYPQKVVAKITQRIASEDF